MRGSGRHGTGHYNTWDMSHGNSDPTEYHWQDGDAGWSTEWPTEFDEEEFQTYDGKIALPLTKTNYESELLLGF